MPDQNAQQNVTVRPPNRWLSKPRSYALKASEARLVIWLRHDIWTLREACDATFGLIPIPFFRTCWPPYWPYVPDAENFYDYAMRAVLAGNLQIQKRKKWGVFSEELIDPTHFGRWAASRPDLVGNERATILTKIFPAPSKPQAADSARGRVLQSQFTTPALEAACAAIDHFWLSSAKPEAEPTNKVISEWITTHFIGISSTAADRIARVIRPGEQ